MLSEVKVTFTRLLDRDKIMMLPDDVNFKISCDRGDFLDISATLGFCAYLRYF